MKTGVAITDIFTGLYSVIAIQAALAHREQTGRGQHIDMALLDSAVSVTANQALNYLATGASPGRLGNAHPNLVPYQVFECRDGWIIIATGNDGQFQRLCAVLSLSVLAETPSFVTNADRVENRSVLTGLLSAKTIEWAKADLLAACEAQGIPAGPINEMADVFADSQVQARQMKIGEDGVPGVRAPFVFSDAELSEPKAAPKLDADGEKIRSGLGD